MPKAIITSGPDLAPAWRVTLRCECSFRLMTTPDLAKPLICPNDDHGMQMIASAVRL
jgi:hypothetical protein